MSAAGTDDPLVASGNRAMASADETGNVFAVRRAALVPDTER
jgi:hypothetical protein